MYDPFVKPFTTKPHRLKQYVENELWQNGQAYTLMHGYAPENFTHGSAYEQSDNLQEWVDETLDAIHENTLGEVEDYADTVKSLFDVLSKPVPVSPLI